MNGKTLHRWIGGAALAAFWLLGSSPAFAVNYLYIYVNPTSPQTTIRNCDQPGNNNVYIDPPDFVAFNPNPYNINANSQISITYDGGEFYSNWTATFSVWYAWSSSATIPSSKVQLLSINDHGCNTGQATTSIVDAVNNFGVTGTDYYLHIWGQDTSVCYNCNLPGGIRHTVYHFTTTGTSSVINGSLTPASGQNSPSVTANLSAMDPEWKITSAQWNIATDPQGNNTLLTTPVTFDPLGSTIVFGRNGNSFNYTSTDSNGQSTLTTPLPTGSPFYLVATVQNQIGNVATWVSPNPIYVAPLKATVAPSKKLPQGQIATPNLVSVATMTIVGNTTLTQIMTHWQTSTLNDLSTIFVYTDPGDGSIPLYAPLGEADAFKGQISLNTPINLTVPISSGTPVNLLLAVRLRAGTVGDTITMLPFSPTDFATSDTGTNLLNSTVPQGGLTMTLGNPNAISIDVQPMPSGNWFTTNPSITVTANDNLGPGFDPSQMTTQWSTTDLNGNACNPARGTLPDLPGAFVCGGNGTAPCGTAAANAVANTDGCYFLIVKATDTADNYAQKAVNYFVDTTPPQFCFTFTDLTTSITSGTCDNTTWNSWFATRFTTPQHVTVYARDQMSGLATGKFGDASVPAHPPSVILPDGTTTFMTDGTAQPIPNYSFDLTGQSGYYTVPLIQAADFAGNVLMRSPIYQVTLTGYAPQAFTGAANSPSKINYSWQAPAITNPAVNHYRLKWNGLLGNIQDPVLVDNLTPATTTYTYDFTTGVTASSATPNFPTSVYAEACFNASCTSAGATNPLNLHTLAAPVINVKVDQRTPTGAHVSWMSNNNPPTVSYDVIYTTMTVGGWSPRQSTTDTQMSLQNLNPSTQYGVCVYALTSPDNANPAIAIKADPNCPTSY